jgi:hypothetical protein
MKTLLFLLLLCANTALAQTAVSLDKQNVLYIGVDNPLTIAAFDTPPDSLDVRGKGAGISITKNGKGHYIARVSAPGEAKIFVKNKKTNTEDSLIFRAKRIPDPVVILGLGCGIETSGLITLARFRIVNAIDIVSRLDFDAYCEIRGFEMTLSKGNGEILTAQVAGYTFNAVAKMLQAAAESGDTVYFDNVKARCPGDGCGRKVNSMVWKIR